MRKKEFAIFGIILLICAGILIGRYLIQKNRKPDQGQIHISARGQEFGIFPLNKDQIISIYDTNVCEIKEGQCTMISATCPSLDYDSCIYQMPISAQNGGMIVCLPNDVVIEYIPS